MKFKDCPYYPCHFNEQDCTFCYCPIYPCKVEGTGEWNNNIWDCTKCHIVHDPKIIEVIKMFMSKAMSGVKN